MIGRRLSHYRIEERLGAGGMGEVYRARDEKLGRDVALKVLPAGALCDESARRRFQKEAEALSRLSHPHVATLLDFDQADGVDFLVMELVVGPTLENEVRKGPLAEKDVVRLGAQLARGLVAAHEQGVVHRDLKPANLQLTADGMLKILDFGVAHLERGGAGRAPSETATETAAGDVLGSPPYMAPEQLLGRPVDARTDIYAAGACLYELATGKRPYGEKRGAELTEAILHQEPKPARAVHGAISPELEAVIRKALDKEPDLRYQTARELLVDLERLQAGATSAGAPRAPRPQWRRWPWLAAAAALVAIAAVVWWLAPRPALRLTNARPLTTGVIGVDATGGWVTDGERVYCLVRRGGGSVDASTVVYQVPVSGGEPAELPAELPAPATASLQGFLRQQSALLVTAGDSFTERGWALWSVPVPAGAPSRVGTIEAVGCSPSPDERLLALTQLGSRLLVVRRDGSLVREWRLPAQPYSPAWSPDARRVRYAARGPGGDDLWIWEVSLAGGAPRALWSGRWGSWTPDGRYFLFHRLNDSWRQDLYAVREPRLRWVPPGQPERLTFGPLSFTEGGPGADGRHLFAWGDVRNGQLLRYDAKAARFEKFLDGAAAVDVSFSGDGEWLAWVSVPELALWRSRANGRERLRLTEPGWEAHLPRWSPDGSRLVFVGQQRGDGRAGSIFGIGRDGGTPDLLVAASGNLGLWDPWFLPDGRILFSHRSVDEPGIYRVDASRQVTPLPGTERLLFPKVSARGDVLAWERSQPGSPFPVYWASFVDRSGWERLGPLPMGYPNWSRDGESFVGLDAHLGRRIVRWSRATGKLETVKELGDIRPLSPVSEDPWLGLAPDGSPLLTRDLTTTDLYALDWEAP